MQTFGELFCGAGGMAYGLGKAGFEPKWAVDADRWACETYRRMIGPHVIEKRVEDMDFGALQQVDGLAFGFPCNDFSMVGERKGTKGYFGGLYKYAKQALDAVRPDWLIAENVPGMLASGGHEIMQHFADAGPGYRLAVHLYKFERYGVPQKRWRVIGVGIRNDLDKTFLPPAPTHTRPMTAGQALKGVERAEHNNEESRHSERVKEMLSFIPPGANCWHEDVPERLRLNVPNVRLSLIYRRLKATEPAYTVVGSGGGGTHMYHHEHLRALTNRERARLQSFPDDFVFEGPKEAVRKQIGMAVPPLGAEVIGGALASCLLGESYESLQPSVGVFEPARKRPYRQAHKAVAV
ncbi:MAG: DNA (cytosine-5-)-methyltransferase [Armatimonadetes bacterium]|nr:DNA (cytosine-5-)-methyltransferase [Armatimonadota bacterium]